MYLGESLIFARTHCRFADTYQIKSLATADVPQDVLDRSYYEDARMGELMVRAVHPLFACSCCPLITRSSLCHPDQGSLGSRLKSRSGLRDLPYLQILGLA